MTTKQTDEIAAIRERRGKITDPPYCVLPPDRANGCDEWSVGTEDEFIVANVYASHGFQGLRNRMGEARENAEFFARAPTDIDTLLAALEESQQRADGYAQLTRQAEALEEKTRNENDSLRLQIEEREREIVSIRSELRSQLTEAHEQIKQLTWERDSAKESEGAMIEAAMEQSRQFVAADRELTEARAEVGRLTRELQAEALITESNYAAHQVQLSTVRAEIEGLRLATQVKMAGEEFLQSTLGQIISTARNDVLGEAIEAIKLCRRTWDGREVDNADLEFDSQSIIVLLESLKRV